MPEITQTKFYRYRQNNSGGSFTVDLLAGIGHLVYVEAVDAEHADARAHKIGLYFDGGGDCSCCGDRWESVAGWRDTGTAQPEEYGETLDQWLRGRHYWDDVAVVHHLNGHKSIYTKSPRYLAELERLASARELLGTAPSIEGS